MAKREPREPSETAAAEVGYYRAFDHDGNVIYDAEDFVAGRSQIPFGVSLGMAAMTICDRAGKVIRKWDPWGVLKRTP